MQSVIMFYIVFDICWTAALHLVRRSRLPYGVGFANNNEGLRDRFNSEVTKSHPKGDDDIEFLEDWFDKGIVVIKMKLPNPMPSQANIRVVWIE